MLTHQCPSGLRGHSNTDSRSGIHATSSQWQRNRYRRHSSSRTMKTNIVATPNGRRRTRKGGWGVGGWGGGAFTRCLLNNEFRVRSNNFTIYPQRSRPESGTNREVVFLGQCTSRKWSSSGQCHVLPGSGLFWAVYFREVVFWAVYFREVVFFWAGYFREVVFWAVYFREVVFFRVV